MPFILFVLLCVFSFSTNLFCVEKADYRKSLELQKGRALPAVPPKKAVGTIDTSSTQKKPVEESQPWKGAKPSTGDSDVWKVAGETESVKKTLESTTDDAAQKKQESFWNKTKKLFGGKQTQTPEKTTQTNLNKKISIGDQKLQKFSDDLKTITPNSMDHIGKTFNPNQFTEAEKKQIVETGDKLLDISAENFKKLPADDQLKTLVIVRARVLQLQQGDKVLAGIGESWKGIERQAGIEKLIDSEREKGTSEDQIKEIVAARRAEIRNQEPYKSDFDKLDIDKEILKDIYGFDPDLQKDRLTKANNLFGVMGNEADLRKNALTTQTTKIKSLLKISTKKLTDDQKAALKRVSDEYKSNIDIVYKGLSEKEQKKISKESESILKKIQSKLKSAEPKKPKFLKSNEPDFSTKDNIEFIRVN